MVELDCGCGSGAGFVKCRMLKSTLLRTFSAGSQKCPLCNQGYPALPGGQPTGTLQVARQQHAHMRCAGHPGAGTLVLNYSFPGGTQGPQHKNPGQRYSGTHRTVYLPDDAVGWRCFALLERAFRGGHAFVVGQSVTTRVDNTVIWGTIHQKTNPTGGTGAHGWPDPGYADRLASECAAKGILES